MTPETRRLTIAVRRSRWEPIPGRSPFGRMVPLPDATAEIELTVDWAALAAMLGALAVRNQSGVAKDCSGHVVARHVR